MRISIGWISCKSIDDKIINIDNYVEKYLYYMKNHVIIEIDSKQYLQII